MKKGSRTSTGMEKPEITIGLDLGDWFSHYWIINYDGEVIDCAYAGHRHGPAASFDGEPAMRIALECSAHHPSGN